MIEYASYVRHEDVDDYLNIGWKISDLLDGTPHGRYSVIMQWPLPGEPRKPGRRQPLQGHGDSAGGIYREEPAIVSGGMRR